MTEWETDHSPTQRLPQAYRGPSAPKLTWDPAKMTAASQATLQQLFQGTTGAVVVTFDPPPQRASRSTWPALRRILCPTTRVA